MISCEPERERKQSRRSSGPSSALPCLPLVLLKNVNRRPDPPEGTDTNSTALPAEPGIPTGAASPARSYWLPATLQSLRHRNYRLFFFGQLISLIGTMMHGTAMGWLIYVLTKSEQQLGNISAVRTFPIVLFSLLGGVLADRHSKRGILVITQICFMMLALVLAALVFLDLIRVWQIVVVGALFGLGMAFDIPARQAFVAEMVGPKDLTNAIALNSSVFNTANIIGPAIGGLVMGAFTGTADKLNAADTSIAMHGIGWCFLINGLSFVAVIAGLMMMRIKPQPMARQTVPALRQAVESLSIVARKPALRGLLALVAIMAVFGSSYGVLMPVFAREVVPMGALEAEKAKGYGLLLSASGLGALAGALVLATLSRVQRKSRLVIGGTMLLAVSLFLFASMSNFWAAAACLVGVGMGSILMASTANSLVQTSVPHEVRGRVMGVWALIFVGAMSFGSIQIGYLAHFRSAATAVKIGAVICAACAVAAFWAVRTMRRRSAAMPPA